MFEFVYHPFSFPTSLNYFCCNYSLSSYIPVFVNRPYNSISNLPLLWELSSPFSSLLFQSLSQLLFRDVILVICSNRSVNFTVFCPFNTTSIFWFIFSRLLIYIWQYCSYHFTFYSLFSFYLQFCHFQCINIMFYYCLCLELKSFYFLTF